MNWCLVQAKDSVRVLGTWTARGTRIYAAGPESEKEKEYQGTGVLCHSLASNFRHLIHKSTLYKDAFVKYVPRP